MPPAAPDCSPAMSSAAAPWGPAASSSCRLCTASSDIRGCAPVLRWSWQLASSAASAAESPPHRSPSRCALADAPDPSAVGEGRYELLDGGQLLRRQPLGRVGPDEQARYGEPLRPCLLYTSDAADEEDSVDLGGRR